MRKNLLAALSAAAVIAVCQCAFAAQGGLVYDENSSGPTPVPPSERGLQTVQASRWFEVTKEMHELEGTVLAADGTLYFSDVTAGTIMRMTHDKKLSTFAKLDGFIAGGTAFGPDGLLYAAVLNFPNKRGGVACFSREGKIEYILSPDAGYLPDDLVFDAEGGIYFSDIRGTDAEPIGGVYYITPDRKTVKPVIKNLAQANGVALSPDGKVLWVGEYGRNRLLRSELVAPAELSQLGVSIPYYFTGPAPDSMHVDKDGNVYVAMYRQGRVLAFNPNGFPIGQILLEGRDKMIIASTNFAISPDSRDMYIVACNNAEGEGAWIFKGEAFAPGLNPPVNSK
ncbi:SMP-30/gluconolactonase/LRE family protein [Cloacibacillus sp. An23]|uniref:SMP-30/gluconolactonase/LRE family protein n=1 Tax=Cloacibacillus sp. An23 TaxID=1965591 RepID=UPI000B574484|nr:SMP-30/gluconolactonase/LRE family protein [Cloacibacillus sp. An23]OUO95246.1 hypothetical protein B5F39_00655 [Cloacibacillus sp. An23]